MYLSVWLINGNRNSKISLQRARADLRRWYHCDRGPYYVGGFYGRPGSIRHRWKVISDFQFFGSQKSALVFVGDPDTSARHLSPSHLHDQNTQGTITNPVRSNDYSNDAVS